MREDLDTAAGLPSAQQKVRGGLGGLGDMVLHKAADYRAASCVVPPFAQLRGSDGCAMA